MPCEENLELMLFIHEDLFDPGFPSWLSFSELPRWRRLGRFGCGLFSDDGGVWFDEKALVVLLVGSTGVGGVTLGGEGSLAKSDTECWTGFRSGTVLSVVLGALASFRTSGDDLVWR